MRTLTLFALFSSLLWLAGCAAHRTQSLPIESPYRDPTTLEKGQILHLKTGRLLSEAELYGYLAHYPVIYVGESHDSAEDHGVQLRVLQAMEERFPGKVALGMEMLRRPSQPKVDDYIQGRSDEKQFLRVWQEDWNNTFIYYRDILRFAREKKIPVVALNASGEVKDAVRKSGLENLPPEIAKEIPELDLDDPYYRAFVDGMMGGHAAGSRDPGIFHRIQVLWDETMAQTAADYLKSPEGQGRRLVVFAGGNHVRSGFGIPRRLFRRLPLPYVIVDPYNNPTQVTIAEEKRMDVELPDFPMPSADVYWSVDYHDLEGERVKLGVQIEEADKKGVKVTAVVPESPGAAAGLQKDDLIVSVDGAEVKEIFDLTYQVGLHKVGDVGPVEVVRGEKRLVFQVTYDVLKHAK